MTVEQILRRIEKQCRNDIKAFEKYEPRWRGSKGPIMKGAVSEARGVVDTCKDVMALCRALRRENRLSNPAVTGPQGTVDGVVQPPNPI